MNDKLNKDIEKVSHDINILKELKSALLLQRLFENTKDMLPSMKNTSIKLASVRKFKEEAVTAWQLKFLDRQGETSVSWFKKIGFFYGLYFFDEKKENRQQFENRFSQAKEEFIKAVALINSLKSPTISIFMPWEIFSQEYCLKDYSKIIIHFNLESSLPEKESRAKVKI